MNIDNIFINIHSSIKMIFDKVIYFDPYKIEERFNDADIIFITHEHYDHFDIESINKIKNDNTIVVAPKTMENLIRKIKFNNYIYLNPNEEIDIDDIHVKTIPAYNIEKNFHQRSNNWLGYVINYDNISYYVAGDTDKTKEALDVKCDVILIPIGGTYTMNVDEATDLIKVINPKIVIPTHYGSIVGDKDDGKKLKNKLSDSSIEVIEKI